jgi:hypothetical protein
MKIEESTVEPCSRCFLVHQFIAQMQYVLSERRVNMSRRIRIVVDHREALPLERLAKLALTQARAERQRRKVEAALKPQAGRQPESHGDAA